MRLLHRLHQCVVRSESTCTQSLMGEGKSTIISPLLALLLADGHRLVGLCVPASLLDFSHAALRDRLTALTRRPVFTFHFGRALKATPQLHAKVAYARAAGAALLTSPTSLKALMLRLLEVLHGLEQELQEAQAAPRRRILMGLGRRSGARAQRALSAAQRQANAAEVLPRRCWPPEPSTTGGRNSWSDGEFRCFFPQTPPPLVGIGQGGRGAKAARDRWAPPPTEGEGSREGQR